MCRGNAVLSVGILWGTHSADPDLWGFCGAEDTQLGEVPAPPGAPGQCQRRGAFPPPAGLELARLGDVIAVYMRVGTGSRDYRSFHAS